MAVFTCHTGTGKQRGEGPSVSLSPHRDLGERNGHGELPFARTHFYQFILVTKYNLLENTEKYLNCKLLQSLIVGFLIVLSMGVHILYMSIINIY